MRNFVNSIINFLVNENTIESDEDTKSFYRYGIELTISSLLNIILVALIGLITSTTSYALVFLLVFILLRSFTGGLHGKTYVRCNIIMCLSYCFILLVFKLFSPFITFSVSLVISVFSLIVITAFCPVANANKPISLSKRKKLKICSKA